MTIPARFTQSRISPSGQPGNVFEQVMSHCPGAMAKWWDLECELRFDGLIEPEIKEEIRRSMAPEVGCQFCASLAPVKDEYVNPRESLAVAYAMLLAKDPRDIDDEVFTVLREEFTEPEIVELTLWSLFMIASQAFGAVLKIPAASDEEITSYSLSRGTTI